MICILIHCTCFIARLNLLVIGILFFLLSLVISIFLNFRNKIKIIIYHDFVYINFLNEGHDKTKVFVFHGGVNGAFEAIYHGVPVVGIPLFADQLDDLIRMRSLGMAEYFEDGIREVTTDRLYKKIMKVATNSR